MCGIAGFFGKRPVAPAARAAMLTALAHRGPDARHVVCWNSALARTEQEATAGLLHTRLSIRDLRAVADQPMTNASEDVWISYNGEVYGWEEERAALASQGYGFKTTGDTEFILHAYRAWGLDTMLSKLRGKFALAILDWRRRKLYLVRDRAGIKPLVYFHGPGEIAFGSTVRAVLPYLTAAERRLAPESIDAYLAHRYVPAPRTIFENVRRLPHGHYACFDLDGGALTLTPYWQPQADRTLDFAATLVESVQLRTVSDRPVGLFLSGGVDSTTVASILASGGHREITAYTAAFPGTEYDESAEAARAAGRLGLKHEILPIESHIADDLERIIADLDEPFADPSSFPLWYIARAAANRVRVVLGGDGGDELFAGYKRYAKHLRTAWRRGLRWPRLWASADGPEHEPPGRLGKLADELRLSWLEAYSLRFSGMPPTLRRYLQPGVTSPPATYWDNMPRGTNDPLGTLLGIDMDNYLPEYILRKADLCTMAHGLELRVPLLDHRLYQSVLALPDTERFTRPRKLALAVACAPCREFKLFDAEKRGFNPPVASWLRNELRPRLDDLGPRLEKATAGQLDGTRVARLVERFLAGDAARAEQVLQLVILDISLRQLLHGPNRFH
jgi:asparagine synthase (glutamine-hydrolysing)